MVAVNALALAVELVLALVRLLARTRSFGVTQTSYKEAPPGSWCTLTYTEFGSPVPAWAPLHVHAADDEQAVKVGSGPESDLRLKWLPPLIYGVREWSAQTNRRDDYDAIAAEGRAAIKPQHFAVVKDSRTGNVYLRLDGAGVGWTCLGYEQTARFHPATKEYTDAPFPDTFAEDDHFVNPPEDAFLRPVDRRAGDTDLTERSATMVKLYDRNQFQNDIDIVERAGHDPRSMLYHRLQWCVSFNSNEADAEHRGTVAVRIVLHEPASILAQCRTHTFVPNLSAPNIEDQLRIAKRRASIERRNAEDAVETVQEVTLLLDKAKERKRKVKGIASAKMKELRHQQRMLTMQLAAASDTIADLEKDSLKTASVESGGDGGGGSSSGVGLFDGSHSGDRSNRGSGDRRNSGSGLAASNSGSSLISVTDPSVSLETDSDGAAGGGGGSGKQRRFVRFAPSSPVRQTVSSPDLGTPRRRAQAMDQAEITRSGSPPVIAAAVVAPPPPPAPSAVPLSSGGGGGGGGGGDGVSINASSPLTVRRPPPGAVRVMAVPNTTSNADDASLARPPLGIPLAALAAAGLEAAAADGGSRYRSGGSGSAGNRAAPPGSPSLKQRNAILQNVMQRSALSHGASSGTESPLLGRKGTAQPNEKVKKKQKKKQKKKEKEKEKE